MQEAYIVAGFRTAVTKSKKGGFRFMRSDELAIELIQGLMKSLPALEYKLIDDVIVGNAVPEAEQGLQFGRIIAAKALGIEVPGITINRYCASGLESIAMATAKIRIHVHGPNCRLENSSSLFDCQRRARFLFINGFNCRGGGQ
jgi:acetyl-CoA acyltransferase